MQTAKTSKTSRSVERGWICPWLVASFINSASSKIKEPLRSLRSLRFALLIPALRRYELSQ